MKKIFFHGLFTIGLWQLLCWKTTLDYYRFFSRKFAQFGIIGVLWPKITIFIIFPTQFSSLSCRISSKINSSGKCRIWKCTSYWSSLKVVNFLILHFWLQFIFNEKLQLSDENWKVLTFLKAQMAFGNGLRYQRPDIGVGQEYWATF